MEYSWLTFSAARQQLAQRLADADVFWTDAENGAYIVEALRTWNALTFTWKTTFTFGVAAASIPVWLSLGSMDGSPRIRTLTDTALYTQMEFHLLEPPTGGIWSGTSQFSIADLSLALQRCRDEAIQLSNCNQLNPAPIQGTPNAVIVELSDTYLDVPRARWMPSEGSNVTLVRVDNTALNYYLTGYMQADASEPSQYNIASLPPLTLQVDIPPVEEGVYDLLVLAAGANFAPPTPSLLNVPDDNAFTLKWGALADLFARESEATDNPRAAYCKQRYTDGLRLLQNTPWVIQAYIDKVPADLVSVTEMDAYRAEWDSREDAAGTVVIAGTDFFTVVPDPNADLSVTLNVLGNAPVPVADGDFIQCSRDVWDSILDYAQFLAAFKQGGAEFAAAEPLEQGFVAAAKAINGRLEKLGIYANLFNSEGQREVRMQERFAGEAK